MGTPLGFLPLPAVLLCATLSTLSPIICLWLGSSAVPATSFGIVIKPKPRERVESRSVGMWHSKILSFPYRSQKYSKSSAGVVRYDKLPTWSLTAGGLSLLAVSLLMVVGSFGSSLTPLIFPMPPLMLPPPPVLLRLPFATVTDAGGKGAMLTTDGVTETAPAPALAPAPAAAFRGIPSLSSLAMFMLRLSSCFSTPLENLSRILTPSMESCKDRRLPSYRVRTQLSDPIA